MKREPLVYLWDARKAADLIPEFTTEKNFSNYSTDPVLCSVHGGSCAKLQCTPL